MKYATLCVCVAAVFWAVPLLAMDCKVILAIPEEEQSQLAVGGGVNLTGLAARILSARGDAEVVHETRSIIQKYPDSEKSLRCSQLAYLACGVLNNNVESSLSERIDVVLRLTNACNIVVNETLAKDIEKDPVEIDSRFWSSSVSCKRYESDIKCGLYLESRARDRTLRLRQDDVELVNATGVPYTAQAFRIGDRVSSSLRYDFKSDTKTFLEIIFENVSNDSTLIQLLAIKGDNMIEKDTVSIRYRNVGIN